MREHGGKKNIFPTEILPKIERAKGDGGGYVNMCVKGTTRIKSICDWEKSMGKITRVRGKDGDGGGTHVLRIASNNNNNFGGATVLRTDGIMWNWPG